MAKIAGWTITLISADVNAGDISVKSFPSPDGIYSAEVFEEVGGGAISPFCFVLVAIHPKDVNLIKYKDYEKYQVYSDDCDSFKESSSPKIFWIENRTVEINFATTLAQHMSRKMLIRSLDLSGQVKVKFISE